MSSPSGMSRNKLLPGISVIVIVLGFAALARNVTATPNEVVELPRVVVDSSTKAWRWAETDTFVILSQASADSTQEIVNALYRSRSMFLPVPLWPQISAKTTVLIFDSPVYPFVPATLRLVRDAGPGHWVNQVKRTGTDHDVFCVNLYGSDYRYSSALRYELRSLLLLTVPRPAPWLERALFGEFGVYYQGLSSVPYGDDVPTGASAPLAGWISNSEVDYASSRLVQAVGVDHDTRLARATTRMTEFLLPVESLFAPPPDDPKTYVRWLAQLGLFARWGMFAERGKHGAAFWQFALRTRTQPVTPELFKECFGLTMSAARNAMAWHLPLALEMQAVREVRPFTLPRVKLRPATQEEVTLYRAIWERLEAVWLAEREPAVATEWRDRARARLDGALEAGMTDARLLAIRGLLAVDAGDLERAKRFLERAARQPLSFPSIYVELARLQLAGTSDDRLKPAETAGILELLTRARALRPLLPTLYEVAAQTLKRSELKFFTDEWRDILNEGVGLFPRERQMLTAVEAAFEAHGLDADASAVRIRRQRFMSELGEYKP